MLQMLILSVEGYTIESVESIGDLLLPWRIENEL